MLHRLPNRTTLKAKPAPPAHLPRLHNRPPAQSKVELEADAL